jgi:hypothetical protein
MSKLTLEQTIKNYQDLIAIIKDNSTPTEAPLQVVIFRGCEEVNKKSS